MAIITSLSPQKKDPNRYNLFIDGEFYCGVDKDTVLSFGLKEGLEVSDVELKEIFRYSEVQMIFNLCLGYLARRPRSEREIRDYIRKKIGTHKLSIIDEGEDAIQQIIENIIERLKSFKYIDDEEFTRWWIWQRTNKSKPDGLTKVVTELTLKGISPEVTKKIWEGLVPDQFQLVKEHYEKVKARYDISDSKDKKRLVNYLMRHGFHWEDIKQLFPN